MKKVCILTAVLLLFSAFACACDKGTDKSNLALNKTELVLVSGETEKLELKKDGITVISGIEWTSSDEKTATVENGVVTAKAKGVAVITATYDQTDQRQRIAPSGGGVAPARENIQRKENRGWGHRVEL